MSTYDVITFSMAGLLAIAATRSYPALALLMWWLCGQVIYWTTGQAASFELAFPLDLLALAGVCFTMRGLWDFGAVALFPINWLFDFHYHSWLGVWTVCLCQFACVIVGAGLSYHREKPVKHRFACWKRRRAIRRGMRFAPC